MKILVPLKVPFVPEMARVGIRLAKVSGADLKFLNVADTRPFKGYIMVQEEVIDLLRKGGEEMLGEAVDLAKKGGVGAEAAVVEGYPHEEILKASEDADLIVLGIRHYSSAGMIGNVTKNVVVTSNKPVFVFNGDQKKFDNVLVAVDGSKCSTNALEYALEFAKIMGLSSISAIFVASSPAKEELGREVLKEATKTSEKSNIKLNTYLEEGNPADEILKLNEKGFNVVILGATGKHTILKFFMGNVSRKVAVFSRRATIIVPHVAE